MEIGEGIVCGSIIIAIALIIIFKPVILAIAGIFLVIVAVFSD